MRGQKIEILFIDESGHYISPLNHVTQILSMPIFQSVPNSDKGHGWYRKFENNDKRPEMGCTKKRRKK